MRNHQEPQTGWKENSCKDNQLKCQRGEKSIVGTNAANTSGLWHKQLFLCHIYGHGWIIIEGWLSSMLHVAHVFLCRIRSLWRWAALDINLNAEGNRISLLAASLCQGFWKVWKSMKFKGTPFQPGKVRKSSITVLLLKWHRLERLNLRNVKELSLDILGIFCT